MVRAEWKGALRRHQLYGVGWWQGRWKEGADLRNISQIKRARLAEGLAVEGESEKKEGVKDDSYIAGKSIRVSGGPVVPPNWGSQGENVLAGEGVCEEV